MTFLSVDIKAPAARRLLVDDRERFATLLERLGPERDLVDLHEPLADDWVGWSLMCAAGAPRYRPDPGEQADRP